MPTRPRTALICLALSPLAVVIGTVISAIFFGNLLGVCLGALFIFVPLTLLAISPDFAVPRFAKWILRLTAALGLVFAASLLMLLAPNVLKQQEPANAQTIGLQPPGASGKFPDSWLVTGLSLRNPVYVDQPSDPRVRVEGNGILAIVSANGLASDGFGNTLHLTQSQDGSIHLQDDLGGYADLRSDGKQFVLMTSHSNGRASSARYPTNLAVKLAKAGGGLFLLTPLVAWLAITAFLLIVDPMPVLLVCSLLLQCAGMVVLVIVFFNRLAGPNDQGEIRAAVHLLEAGILCGLGIVIAAIRVGILKREA